MMHRSIHVLSAFLLLLAVPAITACRSADRDKHAGGGATWSAETNASTTIILVRHAEKFKDPADPRNSNPPLSPEGHARAQQLAQLLGDACVDTVFTSDLDRTKQTAAPLIEQAAARRLQVSTRTYPATSTPASIARLVKDVGPGHTILVVGHSNHVPGILKELGGWQIPEMGEDEFDRIYVATVRTDGSATLIFAGYPRPKQ